MGQQQGNLPREADLLARTLSMVDAALASPPRRPLDVADATVIRHVLQERICELENALDGMIALVVVVNAQRDSGPDLQKHPKFLAAVEARK